MKKIIRILGVIFIFVLGLMSHTTAFADDGWGTYENINWHFYESTGVLQLEGNGEIEDFLWPRYAPWYSYAKDIKTVKIGNGITSIGQYSFCDEMNLTSIQLSETVVKIGRYAFQNTGLKNLTLPNTVQELDFCSFGGCDNLVSVIIPGSIKEIPHSSFAGCKNLASITIGNGVEKLGLTCFSGSKITTINIPASVTKVENAFYQCDSLDHITIPSTVKEVGEKLCLGCDALRYVVYEAECEVPESAFSGCGNLVAVKLGENVTSIGYFSFFDDKKLKIIYIPKSVTEISNFAFASGTNDLTIYGYTDTTGYNFAGMNQFVKFIDVSAQGIKTWEDAWNQAIKSTENKKTNITKTKKMYFVSAIAKRKTKNIYGKLSVSGTTVKIKVGNQKFKKAVVKKKTFSLKTKKLKKGTIVNIRVTKKGYKTINKLLKVK